MACVARIIDNYLPTKLRFLNRVPLQKRGDSSGGFVAVGLFWCRGMRGDVLEGVDRRTLKTFTLDSDQRYTSRTDPGHTFEAYAFLDGVSSTRWQEGELLGRFVAAEGETMIEIKLGCAQTGEEDGQERLSHPMDAALRKRKQEL